MKTNKILFTLAAVMFTLNFGACKEVIPTNLEKPPHRQDEEVKGEGNIRLVTYNVYTFRTSPDIYPNGAYDAIASMMKEIDADAVCLNEIDRNTNRTGKVDQTKRFAEAMGGWDYIYGPAMSYDSGEYGEALTTKAAAVDKKYVAIPKGDLSGSEPRVLCIMEMQNYIIMTTHLDHVDEATRVMQMGVINDYVEQNYGKSYKPIFLGGDLNATHTSSTLQKAQEKWEIISTSQATFPAINPSKSIDIFLAWKNDAEFNVVQTRVLRSFSSANPILTSDHLPVLVEIKLGDNKEPEKPTVTLSMPLAGENPIEVKAIDAEEKTVELKAALDIACESEITAAVTVDAGLLEAYNTANGTSYKIIPQAAYAFDTNEVKFAAGSKESSAITLTLKGGGLSDTDTYLLPVKIGTVNGYEKAQTDGDKSVVYILFSKMISPTFTISMPQAAAPIVVETMGASDKTVDFKLALDEGYPSGAITAKIKTDASLVAAYNAANSTDYSALPAAVFAFDADVVTFAAGEKESSLSTLTLKTSELSGDGDYLLPVTFGEAAGYDKLQSDPDLSVAYVIFRKVPENILTSQSDPENPWEIVFVSSEVVDGTAPVGLSECFIDGNPDTYWHHNYKAVDPPPFYIIIDLKKEVDIYGVKLRGRTHPAGTETIHKNGMPSKMDVSVASVITLPVDSVEDIVPAEWEITEAYDSNSLLWQTYNTLYLPEMTKGRYVLLTIYSSYTSGEPDKYKGTGMSEFNVMGVIPE